MYDAFNLPEGKEIPETISFVDAIVDVRDVGELHARALFTEEAANQRFLNIAREFNWQDACKCSISCNSLIVNNHFCAQGTPSTPNLSSPEPV